MTDRFDTDLTGTTHKVPIPPVPPVPKAWHGPDAQLPQHHAYVTINRDKAGAIVEVFLSTKRSDSMQGTVNALCRVVSAALQIGMPVEKVVKALRGQADGLPAVFWPGRGVVRSVPDALARLLEAESRG